LYQLFSQLLARYRACQGPDSGMARDGRFSQGPRRCETCSAAGAASDAALFLSIVGESAISRARRASPAFQSAGPVVHAWAVARAARVVSLEPGRFERRARICADGRAAAALPSTRGPQLDGALDRGAVAVSRLPSRGACLRAS